MAKSIPPLIWYLGGSVLFLVVVSLLIMVLAGVFHPKIGQAEHGVPAAEVRVLGERPVTEARLVSMPVVETTVGTISAVHETTIAAKTLARITEVNVSAGEQAEKGAVLVRLDDEDLRARLEQAEAAVKLQVARALRKQENLKLRQRHLPWTEAQTVSYPPAATVSL